MLVSIVFAFDTGTDIEIAGKILAIIFVFALLQYVLWRTEMTSKSTSASTKRWFIGFIILIPIFLVLLGIGLN